MTQHDNVGRKCRNISFKLIYTQVVYLKNRIEKKNKTVLRGHFCPTTVFQAPITGPGTQVFSTECTDE